MSEGIAEKELTRVLERLVLLWQQLEGMINSQLSGLPEWEKVNRDHGFTYGVKRSRDEISTGQGLTPVISVRFRLVRSGEDDPTPLMPRSVRIYFGPHGPIYKFGEHAFAPEIVARLAAIYIANGLNG